MRHLINEGRMLLSVVLRMAVALVAYLLGGNLHSVWAPFHRLCTFYFPYMQHTNTYTQTVNGFSFRIFSYWLLMAYDGVSIFVWVS